MWILITVSFSLLLNKVAAIEPEQLKPCFERFDGYKLFDANPFHSEWRMKTEEQCLPFCVKASSRCASIVYDKFNHICHYFSINGIEFESIERNSKMVYLQVAERRCIDEMVIAMDKEEKMASQPPNIDQNLVNGGTILVNIADRDILKSGSNQPKYATQAVETHVEVSLPEHTTATDHPDLLNEDQHFVNGHSSNLVNDVPVDLHTTTEEIQTSTEQQTTTTTEIVNINRDISDEELKFTSPDHKSGRVNTGRNEGDARNDQIDHKEREPTGDTEAANVNKDIFNDYQKENTIPDSTDTENVKLHAQTTESPISLPKDGFNVDSAPALLPVMSVFKATRLASKANADELSMDNNIRRHPVRKPDPPAEPSTLPPMDLTREIFVTPKQIPTTTTKQPIVPVRHAFARRKEALPKAEILPSSIEESLARSAVEIESCQGDVQQIWLAVENSRISTNNSVLKSGSGPTECMRLCKNLPIPHRPFLCDSFTYFEKEQQCQLTTIADMFPSPALISADQPDFTTRVFHKFCYSETLAPFSGCSDFLAFREYSLEMTPKEVFDGLPQGRDGLSACIELCVLSNEFRCRSSLFDSINGICKVFDEHSLSNPIAFKEHQNVGQLYFENGCIDGELPQENVEGSVQRVQQSGSVVQPIRIDFKKVIR
ncbi:PAN domain-containing protein [Ditylenchus destructor]|uniref:PAN domain-containing protein n=1 Tax=Ditylenchus destructor TaxID=166010 RepID=A0AAD4RDC8_9BILA|nr:PAN domain-containing protein [Ditylenchus destructor]